MKHAMAIDRPRWARFAWPALAGVAVARFAFAAYGGLTTTVGDF
jgi:hypothetical protein